MTNKKPAKKASKAASSAKRAPARKAPAKKVVPTTTAEAVKVVFPNDIASQPVRVSILKRWFGKKK